VQCKDSGNVIGHLSLRQTLLKYLKLPDSTPMCAELHQRGPQSLVDMIIPNTLAAEICFEMFNKQPARYLYHVLLTYGSSDLIIRSLLRCSMEAGLTTEAPMCTYDSHTRILTTPGDMAQDGVLSNVCSLPFFQDVLAEKLVADASKKGKKTYTTPEMCFHLGSARSVQTVHGSNKGKCNTVTALGVELGVGTQASAANLSNADQPVVQIASSKDDAPSSEESEGSGDDLLSSDNSFALTLGNEESKQSAPAGSG
jgi:hypothetical protein